MLRSVDNIGYTPNGNTYRKSRKYEKAGTFLLGGMSLIENTSKFLSKIDYTNQMKASKKQLIIPALFSIFSIGINMLWGKLLGGCLDDRINIRKMTDIDGKNVKFDDVNLP